jgi:hypothetical protein
MNYSRFQASCHIIYNPKKKDRTHTQIKFDNNCIKELELIFEIFARRFGSPFTSKSSSHLNMHIVSEVTRSGFVNFASIYEDKAKQKFNVLGR